MLVGQRQSLQHDRDQFSLGDQELGLGSSSDINGTNISKTGTKSQEGRYEYAPTYSRDVPEKDDGRTAGQVDSLGPNQSHYEDDDDGDEDDEPSEKVYRFAKRLPVPERLTNANKKQPGLTAIFGGLGVLVCFGYLLAYFSTAITRHGHVTKVNVILMISDGFGPASETFARQYLQYLHSSNHRSIQKGGRWANVGNLSSVTSSDKQFYGLRLPLDEMLIGSSRTRSTDSLVTDSAAGATAFSCAKKSYNGAIAVEPEKRDPCGTILEAAKHQGYRTGLVVTSRITHATPAAFYAHVPDRDMEGKIAEQLVYNHPLGQQVDLAFGGGLCFFLPNTSVTSCRTDGLDLIKAAHNKKKNSNPAYNVITTRKEFDALKGTASEIGTIGLFARDHMEYEIDRLAMSEREEEREPTLSDMADKALNILRGAVKADSSHGFFLMVEGSRIDMAGHSNDPAGHVHEILSYQSTVQVVRKHVDELNKAGIATVMISVSDHETGGLSLAYQLDGVAYPDYAWYPDALTNATRTSRKVADHIHAQSQTITIEQLRKLLKDELGVSDPDDKEIASILRDKDINDAGLWTLDHTLSKLPSHRAQLGWATEGHSGVDVNLYGYPRYLAAPRLGGNRENTEIGSFIADLMKLNMKQITNSLQHNQKAWYSPFSNKLDDASLDAFGHHNGTSSHDTMSVMHYHGNHKRCSR